MAQALHDSAYQWLCRAVGRAGTQAAFAQMLGVSQQAVSQWLKRRSLLPVRHLDVVEQRLGISRHDLRPDLYPQAEPIIDADPATRFEGAR